MNIDSRTINNLICLVLFAYLIYLLFFLEKIPELYMIVNEAFLNKVFRLLFLVALVLLTIKNPYNIGNMTITILLTITYLLTVIRINRINLENFKSQLNDSSCKVTPTLQNRELPVPFRPNETALSSGTPDPVMVSESGYKAPRADSGVAYQFNMN